MGGTEERDYSALAISIVHLAFILSIATHCLQHVAKRTYCLTKVELRHVLCTATAVQLTGDMFAKAWLARWADTYLSYDIFTQCDGAAFVT